MENKHGAPIVATWILLAIAWLLFIIPVPLLGIIGWIADFVAFVLAIVVLSRGKTMVGIIQLACATVASLIIYLIGVTFMFSLYHAAAQEREKKRLDGKTSSYSAPAFEQVAITVVNVKALQPA